LEFPGLVAAGSGDPTAIIITDEQEKTFFDFEKALKGFLAFFLTPD
jgi:hypothetical protein